MGRTWSTGERFCNVASFFSDPTVQLACAAFALAVLIPLARGAARRTKTPVDDVAVSWLERALRAFRGGK